MAFSSLNLTTGTSLARPLMSSWHCVTSETEFILSMPIASSIYHIREFSFFFKRRTIKLFSW